MKPPTRHRGVCWCLNVECIGGYRSRECKGRGQLGGLEWKASGRAAASVIAHVIGTAEKGLEQQYQKLLGIRKTDPEKGA